MFYDRVNNLCKQQNIKITALVKELELSKSSPTNWKKGVSPNSDAVIKIAKYFNVSTDYLLLGTDENISDDDYKVLSIYRSLTTNGQKEALRHINNIADMETSKEFFPTCKVKHSIYDVSAGVGAEIGDYEGWEYIEVLKTPDSVKANFCLTIKGDSMQPMFNDGDIILVREQPIVDVGQICVYNINNNGYVKKFGRNKLISLNPKYDDVEIPNQDDNIVKCCGLVLGKATVIE